MLCPRQHHSLQDPAALMLPQQPKLPFPCTLFQTPTVPDQAPIPLGLHSTPPPTRSYYRIIHPSRGVRTDTLHLGVNVPSCQSLCDGRPADTPTVQTIKSHENHDGSGGRIRRRTQQAHHRYQWTNHERGDVHWDVSFVVYEYWCTDHSA